MSVQSRLKDALETYRGKDAAFQSYVLHNARLFYTVQTSFVLADRLPLDVDMRKDLWFRLDRIAFATYYHRCISNAFAPVPEMTAFLFHLAKALETRSGLNDTAAKDWAVQPAGIFRKDCLHLLERCRGVLEDFDGGELMRNRLFSGHAKPVDHFFTWLKEMAERDNPDSFQVPFQYRMKALPYFLAGSIGDLPRETLRVLSWDTLFTASNAYAQGGGAQTFAPYLGNDKTLNYLEAARAWRSGKTLSQHRLLSLGSTGYSQQDLSDRTVVTEIYGFLNLHRAAFLNNMSEHGYRSLLNLGTNEATPDDVGKTITNALATDDSLVLELAQWFDALKMRIKPPRSRLRGLQVNKRRSADGIYDDRTCLIHEVDINFDKTFLALELGYNQLEKAVAAAHLLLDATFFQEQVSRLEGRTQTESRESQRLGPEVQELEEGAATAARPAGFIQLRPNTQLNKVFYGPPGTGKTYRCALEAVRIIDGKPADWNPPRENVMQRYQQLRKSGRIEVVTFHQSYAYEDFVEGLRPEVDDNTQIRYEVRPGSLKNFVAKLLRRSSATVDPRLTESSVVWRVSLGNPEHTAASLARGSIGLNYNIDEDLSDIDFDQFFSTRESQLGKNILSSFRDDMKPGDIVCVFNTGSSIRATGIVSGEYYYDSQMNGFQHRRKVDWLNKNIHNILDLNGNKRMTVAALHRLKSISAVQLFERVGLLTQDSICNEPAVLIIDEMNRGNVSKIFGELLTLLEADKRLGQLNEMTVRLPYSGDVFALPPNLFLLATMNTADRSIALLDYAMRRRFHFTYIGPVAELVPENAGGLALRRFFQLMNAQIREKRGREYELGHAPFMNITSRESLLELLRGQIVPLLREYFYDDPSTLERILPWAGEEVWQEFESGSNRLGLDEELDALLRKIA